MNAARLVTTLIATLCSSVFAPPASTAPVPESERDPNLALRMATVQAGQSHYHAPLVKFAAPWTSPFRVDPQWPHQLVNREGEHLFILNKTAWAFFGCEDPAGFLDRARAQGVNVIRVALEGRPYFNELGLDLWPWGGTREKPDWSTFNETSINHTCASSTSRHDLRDCVFAYCCTRETDRAVSGATATLRLNPTRRKQQLGIHCKCVHVPANRRRQHRWIAAGRKPLLSEDCTPASFRVRGTKATGWLDQTTGSCLFRY